MNKPKIRFKGFEDDWEIASLGQLGTFKSNGVDKKINPNDKSINLLNYTDIYNKRNINAANCSSLMQVTATSVQLTENDVRKGDVFFTPSSETPEDIGHCMVIQEDLPNTCYSYHLMRYRPNPGVFSLFYPNYGFESAEIRAQLILGAQGVQRYVLRKEKFDNLNCHLPSFQEQEVIASFFKQIDEMIAEAEREVFRLEKMKQGSLQKMFPRPGATTPEIRFNGFVKDWSVTNLGSIGSTYNGLSGKTKEDFGHGEARFVTYMNVFSNPITNPYQVEAVEIDESQNAVKYGDIFFTTSSETPEEVGMSSVWQHNAVHVYLNSFCFGFRPTQTVDLNYIAYFLRSPFFRNNMVILAQGISRFNISKHKAMELPVLLPEISEQKTIGEFFRNLDALLSSKRQKLTKLRNIKQACLDKMFVNTSEL